MKLASALGCILGLVMLGGGENVAAAGAPAWIADNGDGMRPEVLQHAICEKSGTHLDRLAGASAGRRKYGKYGVGLPKASISQCNKFTVWSWIKGGPKTAHCNGIDIEDEAWIKAGAKVPDCKRVAVPADWLKAAGMEKADSGS